MSNTHTLTLVQFETRVEQADVIDRDVELKGTPVGVTIDTLLKYGSEKQPGMSIRVSDGGLYPLSMVITLSELTELPSLINTFGSGCLASVTKNDDKTVDIAYRFD